MADTQQQGIEWWNPVSWWDSWFNTVRGWIGGLGGQIASGIEGGVISVFKDLWLVILPFVEILLGALIAMWAIALYLSTTKAGQGLIEAVVRRS